MVRETLTLCVQYGSKIASCTDLDGVLESEKNSIPSESPATIISPFQVIQVGLFNQVCEDVAKNNCTCASSLARTQAMCTFPLLHRLFPVAHTPRFHLYSGDESWECD